MLPPAVLLDLDDTILDDSSAVDECWLAACRLHCAAGRLPEADALHAAIKRASGWFWSDAERHRVGRLDLPAARTEVVRLALDEAGIDDRALAARIAAAYASERDARMTPLPDAVETVQWLRSTGRRLALLTNGAAEAQRSKIERFALGGLFDAVLVEGEVGFGKPDARIYHLALGRLGVSAGEACMIGDNLEWDVEAPQRLGIYGVWIDRRRKGLPAGRAITPDQVIASLSDLRT